MITTPKLFTLVVLVSCLAACPQTRTPTGTTATSGNTVRRAAPPKAPRTPVATVSATPVKDAEIILEQRATPNPTAVAPGVPIYRQLTGTRNPANQTTLRGAVWAADGTKYQSDVRVTITRDEKVLESNVASGMFQFDSLNTIVGNIKVTANRYSHAARSQTVNLERGFDYVLNFGEPDQETQMYALSGFPEIMSVSPGFEAKGVSGTAISIGLELSEPVTPVSIENLASALRILPGNSVAAGNGAAPPELSALNPESINQTASATLTDFPYTISFFDWHLVGDTSKLLPKSQYQAISSFTPDESQRKLTVSFPVPLINGKTPGRFQLALASDPERPIKDIDGNILGTDATGKLGTVAPRGQFIQNAFLSPVWSAANFKKDDLNTRWTSTHTHASAFTLAPDVTPPTLRALKVDVRDVDTPNAPGQKAGTTFELQFSEALLPLMGGQTPPQVNLVKDLRNYSFAVGANVEYLGTTTLLKGSGGSGASSLEISPDTQNLGAAGESQLGKEFRFVDPEGKIKIDFINLSVVRILVPNKNLFDRDKVKAVAIRVSGVADVAGNLISPEVANQRESQLRVPITYPAQ